jgi:hypothetical protein
MAIIYIASLKKKRLLGNGFYFCFSVFFPSRVWCLLIHGTYNLQGPSSFCIEWWELEEKKQGVREEMGLEVKQRTKKKGKNKWREHLSSCEVNTRSNKLNMKPKFQNSSQSRLITHKSKHSKLFWLQNPNTNKQTKGKGKSKKVGLGSTQVHKTLFLVYNE